MNDFESVREAAVAYIGIDFNKSTGAVRRNLLKKGAPAALVEDVLAYLQEIDYLDDGRAARRVAARYRGRSLRSRRAMVEVFRRNGIDGEAARRAAEALDEDGDTALALLRASFPEERDEADVPAMQKLLHRRGYDAYTAGAAIRAFFNSSSRE